jgi:hypothetical protein
MMDIVTVILVLALTVCLLVVSLCWAQLKEENERLNQKLQRNNPRDAHGRFTKDK